MRKKSRYLEFWLILGDDLGVEDRKAWPPTLPPDFAADASPTDPNVNTPAASVAIASFANWFSFFLRVQLIHARPQKRGE